MSDKPRILVADDEPVAQLFATTALEAGGFEPVIANDGQEAVEMFPTVQPDVVVLDVMMPRLNGFEACERIRAAAGSMDLPILMLTSRDDVASVGRAYEAGATDFLAKGSSYRLLTERVRFILRDRDNRRALRINRDRLAAVQAMARIGHWELSHVGDSIDVSSVVTDILGGDGVTSRGLPGLREALAVEDRGALDYCIAQWQRDGESFRLDCQLQGGSHIHVHAAANPGGSADARLTLAIQDVTMLREAQQEAERLTLHDALTGLPNRMSLITSLGAILSGRRRVSPMAVMGIHVRGPERILESAGQAGANRAISTAARRIMRTAGPEVVTGRVLSHLGGGDFALILPDCDSTYAAAAIAEEVLEALNPPVEGAHWSVNLASRIGIAFWPQDESEAETLLDASQATAARLPEEGGSAYGFFTPEILARARRRLEVEADMHGALRRGEFRLVYQPRVHLSDLSTRGAEALIRWSHPRLGNIPPLEFINVAEESGLILEIGDWILNQACGEAARWRSEYGRELNVSVNVSSRQLAQPRVLLGTIQEALSRHGLPAETLEIELTESMIIHAGPDLLEVLQVLRDLGISIALDDFGTGYSSLSYLRTLPVDCVKIDRAFVSDLGDDRGAEGVLDAILAVAGALGLRTVAEGIETEAQYRMLANRGCLEGQGYLFAKPLEPASFSEHLRTRQLPALTGTG